VISFEICTLALDGKMDALGLGNVMPLRALFLPCYTLTLDYKLKSHSYYCDFWRRELYEVGHDCLHNQDTVIHRYISRKEGALQGDKWHSGRHHTSSAVAVISRLRPRTRHEPSLHEEL
jgi:hypothetical protein